MSDNAAEPTNSKPIEIELVGISDVRGYETYISRPKLWEHCHGEDRGRVTLSLFLAPDALKQNLDESHFDEIIHDNCPSGSVTAHNNHQKTAPRYLTIEADYAGPIVDAMEKAGIQIDYSLPSQAERGLSDEQCKAELRNRLGDKNCGLVFRCDNQLITPEEPGTMVNGVLEVRGLNGKAQPGLHESR